MSPAQHNIVLSKKQLIFIGATGFGGMIAAVLATLAIMMPIMSAQASSLLDKQAQMLTAQTADVKRVQTGAVATTAAHSGESTDGPSVGCVMGSGEEGGHGAAARGAAATSAVAVSTGARATTKATSAPQQHHQHHAKTVAAPVTATTTIYDNDNVAIDSFNTVTVASYNKDSFNNNDVAVETNRKSGSDWNKNDHKRGHDDRKDHKKNDHHNKHKNDKKHDKRDLKHNNHKNADHRKDDKRDHKKDHDRKDRKDNHKKHDHRHNDHKKDDKKHDRKDDHHNHKDHERKDDGKSDSRHNYRG